jgi:NADH-quinone oxidoreductase subunit N
MNLSVQDITALSPLIILAATALLTVLVISFYRNHFITAVITAIGHAAAIAVLPTLRHLTPLQVTPIIIIDDYSLFYIGLLTAASLVVTVLSYIYLGRRKTQREEFYALLLIATVGSSVLVSSSHFVTLFLGLEVLTVSLYGMIAYLFTYDRPLEAGIKYLVLAAASSAFLLFGMALIFAETGTMSFSELAEILANDDGLRQVFILTGTGMMVVAIGFKLAVVPFHMWTPDIYEAAPAPVTAYLATVSKGGMFAILLRYFIELNLYTYETIFFAFTVIAILSMFTGNILALLQNNVKRILAYSSIAHLGYILVAFLAGGALAAEAVTFYLTAYFITSLGAFGIVGLLLHEEKEPENVQDYRGLYLRRPWLSAVFTAMMLSLAGIPLTAGFIGKFYILTAGVGAALWVLVISLVVNSALGLYYYLRIVIALYSSSDETGETAGHGTLAQSVSITGAAVLAFLMLTLVLLGIYPEPLIAIIRDIASRLGS